MALVASLVVGLRTGAARAADGDLDPTFSGDGKVVSDFGFDDRADGVAVQPDGRIVVAGTSCNGDFFVARYLPDGSLDTSFSGDGSVCVDVGAGSSDQAEEVFVLGDGRLLVAGTSGGDFALVRLNPDGSVDPTFGTGGRATYDFGGTELLHDAALAPDGKVVMVGETTGPGCSSPPSGPTPGQTSGVAVARVTADGALDPTFGTGGTVVRLDANHVQRGFAVAVQTDGLVVVAGRIASCSRVAIDALVFRLTTSGAADATFLPANLPNEPGPDSAVDVAVQPDGKIIALIDTFVGPATEPAHNDAFTVVRYNPDGSADATFGTGGVALALFGAGRDATPTALAVQGNKIVAGGSVDGDFALARFNSDGSLDPSFDGDGMVVTDVGGTDGIAALAVQLDGKIVTAGRSNADVALARYGPAPSGPSTTTAPSTTPTSSPTTSSPTTSSTTTSSTSTTSTTTTTVLSPLGAACSVLRNVVALFRADPVLRPFAPMVERLSRSFCPA